MPKKSAGILLYRKKNKEIEFFLGHPGGPFYFRKDKGVWSIPKGEFDDDEEPLEAAKREFEEETGYMPEGRFIELTPFKLKSGKNIFSYAVEGDLDPLKVKSNTFEMEWPPKSGRIGTYPEIDRGEWFNEATAKSKIINSQVPLIDELLKKISKNGGDTGD